MKQIGIGKSLGTVMIKSAVAFTLTIALFAFSCATCNFFLKFKHSGKNADLYTVAVNNIFGINGYIDNGEVSNDPKISIIETDEYGRTLFFYNESGSFTSTNKYSMAFVIMQKSTSENVYYYQDVCYLPFYDTSERIFGDGDHVKAVEMSDALIQELKEKNDWNEEIDLRKCKETRINTEMPEGDIKLKASHIEDKIYSYAKSNGYTGSDKNSIQILQFCNADATGKELYYVYAVTGDDAENGEKIYQSFEYAIIVDISNSSSSDIVIGENAIVEIKESDDYYDLIMKLKKQNNWVY